MLTKKFWIEDNKQIFKIPQNFSVQYMCIL